MGRAIALRFAEEGARLYLVDISGARLAESETEVRGRLQDEGHLWARRADVTDSVAVDALVSEAETASGGLDILINVVGGIRGEMNQPFVGISEDRWDDTFRLNLKGTHLLSRALAPGMVKRRYGRIVNVSSVDFAGAPGRSDYGAAKAAVSSLTRSMARELAPHVNVNCIAPGLINTSAVPRLPQEMVEGFIAASALGRIGEPVEIAHAALFLASAEASFITGETLAVSGGIPARL